MIDHPYAKLVVQFLFVWTLISLLCYGYVKLRLSKIRDLSNISRSDLRDLIVSNPKISAGFYFWERIFFVSIFLLLIGVVVVKGK